MPNLNANRAASKCFTEMRVALPAPSVSRYTNRSLLAEGFAQSGFTQAWSKNKLEKGRRRLRARDVEQARSTLVYDVACCSPHLVAAVLYLAFLLDLHHLLALQACPAGAFCGQLLLLFFVVALR